MNDEQIQKSAKKEYPAIWGLAFRPFFLSAAMFSILSLVIWLGLIQGWWQVELYGGSGWWHAHEMLFGFVVAVIVGFLLTAVQTWTGVPSIKGWNLARLWGVWMAARIVLLFDFGLPEELIALIDISFLPIAAWVLFKRIYSVKQWRNLVFVPILLLMTAMNVLMHASVLFDVNIQHPSSYAMVLLISMVMTIIGGRVIPMFTASGTQTAKVDPIGLLEVFVIASTALLVFVFVFSIPLSNFLLAILFATTAWLHLLRWLRWRVWVTFYTPLVWSLHLSYLCIPIGFGLMASYYSGAAIYQSVAIHSITVGAIGLMILSMISRVSLGHTGRLIVVGPLLGWAFASIFIAFLLRVLGVLLGFDYLLMLTLATLSWSFGYGVFVWQYWAVLTKPRVDGREG